MRYVQHGTPTAGFNKINNASSDHSSEYSFLYEERMFKLKVANFKEYNKIQKNSNSEQHFDCFIESTFRLGCSHHQD